jgi:protein-disulfide isomerase
LPEKYPGKVRVVFKNFPLSRHKYAQKAASAALAARKQGKYIAFHDALFQNYKILNDTKIMDIAKELKLDIEQLQKDMEDPAIKKLMFSDIMDGRKADVQSVPSMFLNGKYLQIQSTQELYQMIEEELKNIDQP